MNQPPDGPKPGYCTQCGQYPQSPEPTLSGSLIQKIEDMPEAKGTGWVAVSDVIEIIRQHQAAPEVGKHYECESAMKEDMEAFNASEICVIKDERYKRGYDDGYDAAKIKPVLVSLEKCIAAAINNRRDGLAGEIDPNWQPSNYEYGNIKAEVESVLSAAGVKYVD